MQVNDVVASIRQGGKKKAPKSILDFGALLDSSKKKQWYSYRPGFFLMVQFFSRSFLIFLSIKIKSKAYASY